MLTLVQEHSELDTKNIYFCVEVGWRHLLPVGAKSQPGRLNKGPGPWRDILSPTAP